MAEKSAEGDEAVAIAAAVARFEAEQAVRAVEKPAAASPWQRVALLEGVDAMRTVQDSEGGARWLS